MAQRSQESLPSNLTSGKLSEEAAGDHEQNACKLAEKQERKGNWIKHCSHSEHELLEAFSHCKFNCQVCKHKGDGMRYRCKECNFQIHTGCGSLPDSLPFFAHEHQLFLKESPINYHLNKCRLCGGTIKGMVYRCEEKDCKFLLHPTCSQLQELVKDQPSHPPHPLRLGPLPSKKCDLCEKKCKHWSYHCDICDAHLHVGCMDRIRSSPNGDHGGGKDSDRKCSGRACFKCLMCAARAVLCVSALCG